MNPLLAIALLLVTAPALAQATSRERFADEWVSTATIQLAPAAQSDSIRIGVMSWGDFVEVTQFDVGVVAKPAFVGQVTFADGAVLEFAPDDVARTLTVNLTLDGSGSGELVLEVRPRAEDIQPRVRRIVLPVARAGDTEEEWGEGFLAACLADADAETPPPAACTDSAALYPTDSVWVLWDTPFADDRPFEWRIMGPDDAVRFSGYHDTSSADESDHPLRDGQRVNSRFVAALPGEHRLEFRTEVDPGMPTTLFGMPPSRVTFVGDWLQAGAFDVEAAIVQFKGFTMADVATFKTRGPSEGNVRANPSFQAEPAISLGLLAEWDRRACRGDEITLHRERSRANIELVLPPLIDLAMPVDPNAAQRGARLSMGDISSAINEGTDYFRRIAPDHTFYPMSVRIDTLESGWGEVEGCNSYDQVEFSIQLGDLHATTQSLGSLSMDAPLRGKNFSGTLMYKNPTPSSAPYRTFDLQKGHDYIRGPQANVAMKVRALTNTSPFGEPKRRLGDHLRDPNALFVVPIDFDLTMYTQPKRDSYWRFGTARGYAIYGSDTAVFAGVRPGSNEATLQGAASAGSGGQPGAAGGASATSASGATRTGSGSGTTGTASSRGASAGAGTTTVVGATAVSGSSGTSVASGVAGTAATSTSITSAAGAPGSVTVDTGTSTGSDTAGTTAAASGADSSTAGTATNIAVSGTAAAGGTAVAVISPSPAGASGSVANVIGVDALTARTRLQRDGFNVTLAVGPPAPTSADADRVARTNPAPGTRLPAGANVEVVIYAPAPTVIAVPDLIGQHAARARERLSGLGLRVSAALGRPAPNAALADAVERLEPAPGTRLSPGAAVTMVVHTAPASGATAAGSGAIAPGSAAGLAGDDKTEQAVRENQPGTYVVRLSGTGFRMYFGGAFTYITGEHIVVLTPRKNQTLGERLSGYADYWRGSIDPCKPGGASLCPCPSTPSIWETGPFVQVIGGPYPNFSAAWDKYACDKSNVNTGVACDRFESITEYHSTSTRFKDFQRARNCPVK